MASEPDADLVSRSAKNLYGVGQTIWDRTDAWNNYKRDRIDNFVRSRCAETLAKAQRVLNAGSGGEPYGWLPRSTVNVDLFEAQVKKLPQPLVADLAKLPFKSGAFDFLICVGSVLNYVSAIETLAEFDRILSRGGFIILHYETSQSFEHVGRSSWHKPVARVRTSNSGRLDDVWVYSRSFIKRTIESFGWQVIAADRFHILSSAAIRLGLRPGTAAQWAIADRFLGPLGRFADDEISLISKIA